MDQRHRATIGGALLTTAGAAWIAVVVAASLKGASLLMGAPLILLLLGLVCLVSGLTVMFAPVILGIRRLPLVGAPKPKPGGVPVAISPPRIGLLEVPGQHRVNPAFPNVEMVWRQPERWSEQRFVYPEILITNRSLDRVINLSFKVFNRFAHQEGADLLMPLEKVEGPDGLPHALRLDPQDTKIFKDQGFRWVSPIDFASSRDGCEVEACDHLSGERVRFEDRYSPEETQ